MGIKLVLLRRGESERRDLLSTIARYRIEKTLDRTYDPISPVLDGEGKRLLVRVPLFDPPVTVAVWKVAVGRVPLYLLDTDIEANRPWDRAIT